MFCNFFYKIQTECKYEKCPRTWFLIKNWSKYDYVKHAKIKKIPCRTMFVTDVIWTQDQTDVDSKSLQEFQMLLTNYGTVKTQIAIQKVALITF